MALGTAIQCLAFDVLKKPSSLVLLYTEDLKEVLFVLLEAIGYFLISCSTWEPAFETEK
jgi:hypothetical protein